MSSVWQGRSSRGKKEARNRWCHHKSAAVRFTAPARAKASQCLHTSLAEAPTPVGEAPQDHLHSRIDTLSGLGRGCWAGTTTPALLALQEKVC